MACVAIPGYTSRVMTKLKANIWNYIEMATQNMAGVSVVTVKSLQS